MSSPGLVATKTVGAGALALALAVPGWPTLAALVLITSLGPWALPQMVQKFYSIRSRVDVRRALVIAGVFSVFMAFSSAPRSETSRLLRPGEGEAASA